MWSNWLDGIRRAQGKARRVQKYVTQDESLWAEWLTGQQALSLPIPASGTLPSKHRLNLATPEESLREIT